jgi:hypothetical protein
MNNVFKLLLAAVCVAAPLFGVSPAAAGGHGGQVRGGWGYRGWSTPRGEYGCSSPCGAYVDRFDDCGRVRRGRTIVRVERHYRYVGPKYQSGPVIGNVYGDEQVTGGKYSSIPGGKSIGGKIGGGQQVDVTTSDDEQNNDIVFDSNQTTDDSYDYDQNDRDSYASDDIFSRGSDQNDRDSYDYDQYDRDSYGMNEDDRDSYDYDQN